LRDGFVDRPVTVSCGQCIGCRLERSRQWAVRCMHEASLHTDNCFVTLTYSDEGIAHLDRSIDPETGEIGAGPLRSLNKRDIQLFMKRLRKRTGAKIRYLQCGEYGSKTQRPHHHVLLFGFDFQDKYMFAENRRLGVRYYRSPMLEELWPYGMSALGDLTFESAAYVARYVMKKVTGDRAEEHYAGRQPEYTTMSRRPGIGKGWYEKFKTDVYPRDGVVVRGHITRPPRFYDNLLGIEDRSTLEQLKIKREEKNGFRFVDDVLSSGRKIRVSDSDSFRLRVKEEVKRAELSTLRRSLEEV